MPSVASIWRCGICSASCAQEPVYHLLGGAVRDELIFYATGARPDLAKEMGFIGGKLPLHHCPAEGEEGLQKEPRLAGGNAVARRRRFLADVRLLDEPRSRTTPSGWLTRRQNINLKWIEEALPPDDYWGYAELRKKVPPGMLVTTGEHEATRWGFRMLLEMECADILQPDVGWCGGIDGAYQDLGAGRCARCAGGAARFQRLQLSLRDHAPQQPVFGVPDDGAAGRQDRSNVFALAAG